ncbi:MAG: dNTP triphosphohydrolase, partial [Phycisphaerae bacterium]|nr:dNTP triphosphohydrolase [Phycisphaerae bacterium]
MTKWRSGRRLYPDRRGTPRPRARAKNGRRITANANKNQILLDRTAECGDDPRDGGAPLAAAALPRNGSRQAHGMVKADRFSREHPEPLAETLSPLELDRHRIVNAAAFRRLQYKTQVFVAPEEDHFRTRMTHTLEVAHLARLLAAALRLDFGLAEVVALAHDLGHPPFGHAGERALADCMAAHGGYEHNRHALRVVEHLEHPYPDFPGLNLTRVVRECLAKHTTRYDLPGPHPLQDGRPPPPEGQVAALADRLAYALHDLQDGVYAGVIEPAALDELAIWRRARQD